MAQFCQRLVIAWAVLFLTGCASTLHNRGADGANNDHWQGRLAVTLYSRPVQAFAASFELQGNAQVGSLYFFTPLGSTAAQLHWDAEGAQLQTTGDPQRFESLDALTLYTTGASLPIASLFAWLQGQESDAPGWTVDLHDLANGRLLAQRLAPQTPAELKIILER